MDILSDIKEMSQILGKENIDCLTALFEELKGQPPRINKKRYRADHSEQIEPLNYLENSVQLIKTETIRTEQFYHLRAYALPLIKTSKAQNLLNLMSEIYQTLPTFYKERLNAPVKIEELLNVLDAPTDNIVEALAYFKDTHDIFESWGNEFPYEEKSQINLSENVIFKREILEILTDYYRWNFIGKKADLLSANNKKAIFSPIRALPEIKIKDKKSGRPTHANKINDTYELLKNENKIDFKKPLNWNIGLIRETILHSYPELNGNTVGLGDDAISNKIYKRFNADKENYKLT